MAAHRRIGAHDGGCDDVVVVLGAAVVDVPAPARPVVATRLGGGDERVAAGGYVGARIRVRANTPCVITVDTPDIGADVVRRVLDRGRAGFAIRHRAGPLR